jgi:hypothetical protein
MCGTFVNYVACVYNSYQGEILFVALTDETNYILRTVFQRYDDYITDFKLNGFRFRLLGVGREMKDVARYRVSYGGINMNFLFVGIDITTFCNPLSNLDFVHYFWDNHQCLISTNTPSLQLHIVRKWRHNYDLTTRLRQGINNYTFQHRVLIELPSLFVN